ncbi:15570_t:CDS:2, partial [Racocetra persica]
EIGNCPEESVVSPFDLISSKSHFNFATSVLSLAFSEALLALFAKIHLAKKTATGILCKHLDTQHPGWSTIEIFALTQTVSIQSLTVNQKARFNILLAEWIVSDTLPFLIVGSKALITLLKFFNATLELLSRETIKSIVYNSFISMRGDVQTLFEQISGQISITLDLWTSRANMPFLATVMRHHSNLAYYRLSQEEDSDLQAVTWFLQPFYEITNILSGSTYVTLGLSALLIDDIIDVISLYIQNSSSS